MSGHTQPYEDRMKKTVSVLEEEFSTIRVGRANPRVLDRLMVNYYGSEVPISQVGNITVPEPRLLMIAPWEANMLKEVEKAILASDLGLNPTNDGKVIRLNFPELTEERRKQLTKDVKKKGEDSKVAIRNLRREAMDAFKKLEKKSELTEDDVKDLEKEIQDLTDKYVAELDKKVDAKNKDIMTV
ncbi:MAG: ribosome recycling factor [Defluviitaleaceae bacterium]|nr:ribosome recycling factor [Defluviitaleaceae bacterium]